MRIKIAQFGDVYLLIIVGELKKEFKTKGIKESFIHLNDFEPIFEKSEDGQLLQSAKKSGIEWDPNMESYLEELTNFLKDFGFGIYLNEDSNHVCPNIKVAYMEEIPFDNFDEWSLKNSTILKFLGFSVPIFSKIKKNIWGIQRKRITNKLSISAGLVILTSKDEAINDKYESMESGILINIEEFISFNKFIDVLYRLYWANYNLEKIAKDSKKSLDYVDKLNKIETQKVKIKMKSLFKLNNEITKKYLNFEIYRINEERKYYLLTKNIKYDISLEDSVEPLKNINIEYSIYKYIFISGKELLENQKREIESLKKEFVLLFSYLNNVTHLTSSQINLNYQGKVKTYTFVVLILTFIMILININMENLLSILEYLYAKISSLLMLCDI